MNLGTTSIENRGAFLLINQIWKYSLGFESTFSADKKTDISFFG